MNFVSVRSLSDSTRATSFPELQSSSEEKTRPWGSKVGPYKRPVDVLFAVAGDRNGTLISFPLDLIKLARVRSLYILYCGNETESLKPQAEFILHRAIDNITTFYL